MLYISSNHRSLQFLHLVASRGRIRRFAVGPVYPNKSPTMCSSDFVFRKYKQDSAFRVSGVLQLAKIGPLVTKNSRSFAYSSQML